MPRPSTRASRRTAGPDPTIRALLYDKYKLVDAGWVRKGNATFHDNVCDMYCWWEKDGKRIHYQLVGRHRVSNGRKPRVLHTEHFDYAW